MNIEELFGNINGREKSRGKTIGFLEPSPNLMSSTKVCKMKIGGREEGEMTYMEEGKEAKIPENKELEHIVFSNIPLGVIKN